MKTFLTVCIIIMSIKAPIFAGNILKPTVKVDSAGNTYAIWLYSSNFDYNCILQAAIAPAGGAWTIRDLAYVTHDARPTIEINPQGDIVVAWLKINASNIHNYEIVTRSALTKLWSDTTSLITSGCATSELSISINPNGQAIAIWKAFTSASSADTAVYSSTTNITSGVWSAVSKISP